MKTILIVVLLIVVFLQTVYMIHLEQNLECEIEQPEEKIIVIVINDTVFSDGEYLYYELLPNETK